MPDVLSDDSSGWSLRFSEAAMKLGSGSTPALIPVRHWRGSAVTHMRFNPWTFHPFDCEIHIFWRDKPRCPRTTSAQLVAAIISHKGVAIVRKRKSQPISFSLFFFYCFVLALVSLSPCFYFQCAVCFWSRCRIVTIKLNNTGDVTAVFVCCESELTQNEKRFLPSPAWGLIIFPLLSSPDGGKLI